MMNASNEQILIELEKTPGAVENLLLQVFVPVTENIKRAEEILKAYILRSSCVPALIEQMGASQHANARQLSAVLLRKSLPRHWKSFDSKDQETAKATLLELIKREPERVVRQSLAVLISQLAKVLYDDNKTNWPELLGLISVLTQDPDPSQRELSFVLLHQLAEASGDSLQNHYGELKNVFNHALDDPNPKVQAGALQSSGALLTHLRMEKEGKLYAELIPKTLSVAKACMARGDEESVVSVNENLCEWCLSPQPLIKPYVVEIVDYLLYVMGNEGLELSTRDTASLVLSTLAETKGKLLAKSGKVPACLEVFATLIASYEGSAANSLFRYEALDYNDENEDAIEDGPSQQSIAQTALDEMALNLPTKSIFEPVMSICATCFPSPNPKMRKAGVAMMGVITEGCQEAIIARLNQILPEVLRAAQDVDENVRECACFCLGQFSEHCQPDVLDYHAEILPVIFRLLQDATDSVKGVSCYVLEMFCENLEPHQVLPILEPLMNQLLLMLETPKKSIQEMTVAAIAATAIAAEKDFEPYVVMVYKYIGQLLTITVEPMLGLRGRALECMGHIAIAVEADAFSSYVEACMACAIQGLTIDSVDLHEYTYTFFANLSKVFGDRMAPYVPDLVNHLLGEVAESDGEEIKFPAADPMGTTDVDFSLLDDASGIGADEDYSDHIPFFNVRTAMMDKKKAALLALGALAEYASASYVPFLAKSLAQLAPLCDYWHGDIRSGVCNCLKCLVKVSISSSSSGGGGTNPEQQWEKGKMTPLPEPVKAVCDSVMSLLIEIMLNDPEPPVVTAACEAFSDVLDLVGPSIVHVNKKLIQVAVTLLDEKTPCQTEIEEYSDEEYDAPEEGEGQVLVESVGEMLCAFARVLGEHFIPALDTLWPKLAKYSQGRPPREKAMAMGTFAEIIEEIGPASHRYFDHLLPMVKRCMSDEDARVRRNTAFCIGIMAETAGSAYKAHFPALLESLAATFQNSTNGVMNGGQQETCVLDNAASAVARIIMADEGTSPWIQQALPVLLSALPLKVDMNENRTVYQCVSGLLVMGHPVALQHASTILTALSKALGQEKVDVNVKKEIASQLQNMSKTEHSSTISAAMQTVPENLQQALLQAIHAAAPIPE